MSATPIRTTDGKKPTPRAQGLVRVRHIRHPELDYHGDLVLLSDGTYALAAGESHFHVPQAWARRHDLPARSH